MRAIRVYETGGPDVMKLVELPTPSPGSNEVLARVEAAGVNFIDIYHRSGQYPLSLPIPLGLEGAGVVEAVGDQVRDFKIGDRIAWARASGSYASHVLVECDKSVLVPDGIDSKTAAAAMLQGMTAHYLTHSTYALSAGEDCLVHAAAGGVGLLLCQIAKKLGARVIGTVSTEQKAKQAKAMGADEIILYKDMDFVAETRRLTRGKGVAVVYDSVGKDTFSRSLECLRPRGMMVLFGQSSGAVPPMDPQILAAKGSIYFTRPKLHDYTATREEFTGRAGDLFRWILEGCLCITIGQSFALEDAALAHEKLGARETSGKLLLIP